ncbi:transposase [Streptomyces sp. NPDC005009]
MTVGVGDRWAGREIVNAILYVNRTGIPWEYLPHDFPPYKTVYDYYANWEADGTTQQVHDLLRDKTRRSHGRSAQPTAAVIDARSVKTSASSCSTTWPPPIPPCRRSGPTVATRAASSTTAPAWGST